MRAWQVLMMPHTMAMLPIQSLAPNRMVMKVLGSIATPNPAHKHDTVMRRKDIALAQRVLTPALGLTHSNQHTASGAV
jgi:hypothetical protein